METKDWLDGFYAGQQYATDEIIGKSLPAMDQLEKNLDSLEKNLDSIEKNLNSINDKISYFLDN